jgi:hypothetical protein
MRDMQGGSQPSLMARDEAHSAHSHVSHSWIYAKLLLTLQGQLEEKRYSPARAPASVSTRQPDAEHIKITYSRPFAAFLRGVSPCNH